MKSVAVSGRRSPFSLVHGVSIKRAISAATSSASSSDSVMHPSCSAGSQRSPVPSSVVWTAQLSWLRSRPS